MNIQRVNTYHDHRFSQRVLNQHGCFLADNQPIEIEITSQREAEVRGKTRKAFPAVIEEFRFFSPQITSFYDQSHHIVMEYPPASIFPLQMSLIQPSQFFVDEEKIKAVGEFTHSSTDIVIQVIKHNEKFISLDGHTRLYYAAMMGWPEVYAVEADSESYIFDFVKEAIRRGITAPWNLQLVDHETYEEKWNRFCDDFFAQRTE